MKRLTLAAALIMSSVVVAAPVNLERGKAVVDQVCAACHGTDGNSGIATYPRLSAQHTNYATKEALAIKKGERKTGAANEMLVQVQNLSDEDIINASAYYAKQLAKSGEANPKANPELGAKIYRSGIPERNVPACMSCHGANGAGMPGGGTNIVAYPRIAGQHGTYVETQLKAYASGERVSPSDMMKDVAARMTDEDMKAVGNFIQGLK
ncbi:MAG: cytochrome c4 [Neisseriaceae bacterium]|nr:cytochrome c4 [Neisseriaceae bacterium]MBR6876737.1 cytochrome c4 [Neisseriaceae bacterium]